MSRRVMSVLLGWRRKRGEAKCSSGTQPSCPAGSLFVKLSYCFSGAPADVTLSLTRFICNGNGFRRRPRLQLSTFPLHGVGESFVSARCSCYRKCSRRKLAADRVYACRTARSLCGGLICSAPALPFMFVLVLSSVVESNYERTRHPACTAPTLLIRFTNGINRCSGSLAPL